MSKYFNYYGNLLNPEEVYDLYLYFSDNCIILSREDAVNMDSLMSLMEDFLNENGLGVK